MGFVAGEQERPQQGRIALVLLPPLLVVFIAVVLVFRVVYQVMTVDGASMEPALYSWDYLLATRGYTTPRRGDIVSISSSTAGAMPLVKRVVAIPGDTIAIDGEHAVVNGLPEPWTVRAVADGRTWPPTKVPAGTVWVMGDNRDASTDSRYFGFVPLAAIRGRALLVYWPPLHVRLLDPSSD